MFVVNNLKMPVSCEECPLDPSACTLWQEMPVYMSKNYQKYKKSDISRRHEDCPIKPVIAIITDDNIRLEIRELDI